MAASQSGDIPKKQNLPILENWLAHNSGAKPEAILEFPLFTDVHVTDEVRGGCGPYWFLNTVAIPSQPRSVCAAIVLRCAALPIPQRDYRSLETSKSDYHGGGLIDEVTALASLFLGARIKAGGMSRSFEADDPLGQPCGWNDVPVPAVNFRRGSPILPVVLGSRDLAMLNAIDGVTNLSNTQVVALIRSASFYQDALWIGESEPNLAWLMFVSALEAAACCWETDEKTNFEKLRDAAPKLYELLKGKGDDDFVGSIADLIAPSLKSTKKFLDFCVRFAPPPPEKRPTEQWLQIDWSEKSWKKIFNVVYQYRSEALHSGIPFPHPMCEPPYTHEGNNAPNERGSLGLAAHFGGATWNNDDLPVSLNTFADVTRRILLSWFDAMKKNSTSIAV